MITQGFDWNFHQLSIHLDAARNHKAVDFPFLALDAIDLEVQLLHIRTVHAECGLEPIVLSILTYNVPLGGVVEQLEVNRTFEND